ncbi:aromatic acid exporter family protein [Saccharomonospora saliphila]|uniref:hypothetical protein n=1 Tax=Saccharomonospora saliphila TaxID=369829 RepID=UPI0003A9DDC2|nr:hypothetical protein [Saccharomonospora saliphila]
MSEGIATPTAARRPGVVVVDRVRERGRALLDRARTGPDTWHLLLKCTLAASLSWWIAAEVLSASAASFAPFSAVLLVYATVARSVYHSIRYVGAMVAGIVLAGGLTSVLVRVSRRSP